MLKSIKKEEIKTNKENLKSVLTERSDYDIIARALLDSSLISQSKEKIYDIKIIECGNYYQIYNYNKKRIIRDKTLIIDKKKIIIKCNIEKIKALTKKELKIKEEYKKFYENPMYSFHIHFNFEEFINRTNIQNIDTDNLKTNKKEILLKNINRSKFQLQRIVKSNIEEFKTFTTLTFSENIKSIDEANKIFNIWRRNIKRIKKDFKYVCVPEFQKRGVVHYHLLTNIDYNDTTLLNQEERKIYNKKSGWQIGKDIKGWKYGHNMTKNMNGINVIGYITKYMTKDIDNRLWGKRRYLYSLNLKKPSVIYLNLNNIEELIKYFNIIDYNLEYSNIFYTKSNDTIEYKEYRKIKI